MLDNDYNPVVTKNELIDIIYENLKKAIAKENIEAIIDGMVKPEDKNNEIYCISREKLLWYSIESKNIDNDNKEDFNKVIASNEYKEIYYFKINENKYIFFYFKRNIDAKIYYLEEIEQIDYILDNRLNNGINDDELKHEKVNRIKDLNELREKEPLNEQFKKYDYIKIICENNNYNYIEINDIIKCADFLDYNEEHEFLTLEEQIILRLIILLGIKNIYLNYSEYYQEKHINLINYIKEKINEYILFISENIDNIDEKTYYSFDYQYEFNLKEYCSRILKPLKENYNVWNREVSLYEKVDNEFIPFLKYISFDYYVSNKQFEKAYEIFQEELPLFKYLKGATYESVHMILELILETLEKRYKNNEDEWHKHTEEVSVILSNKDNTSLYNYFSELAIPQLFRKNIKVILKFYKNCYYYFLHFKDEENANKIFEFLLYFKDGYDIEDFIFKCRYMKMVEILNGNKIENIDDSEEVDNAINKIEEKIDYMKLINQFDIDDVENYYNHIKFNNFSTKNKEYVKKCIATGDKIMNIFDALDIDFSNVVIEWSKAVETAIDEKLFSDEIISYNEKIMLEKSFKKIDYNGNELHFKLKNAKNITVGIFNDMENYKNGKCNLLEYLYDTYYSKYYDMNKETYKKLCEYLKKISTPRNQSAHKGKTIDKSTAMDCKDKILASERILEILSKLEKRK